MSLNLRGAGLRRSRCVDLAREAEIAEETGVRRAAIFPTCPLIRFPPHAPLGFSLQIRRGSAAAGGSLVNNSLEILFWPNRLAQQLLAKTKTALTSKHALPARNRSPQPKHTFNVRTLKVSLLLASGMGTYTLSQVGGNTSNQITTKHESPSDESNSARPVSFSPTEPVYTSPTEPVPGSRSLLRSLPLLVSEHSARS